MSKYMLNNSHLIISGHIVSSEPILPAMGYLHFVAASLLDNKQSHHQISLYPLQVKDAVWFAPLTIAAGECQVNVHLDTEGEGITYWVTSTVPGKATKRHATGVVFSGLNNGPDLIKKPATHHAEEPVFRLPDTSSHAFTHRLNRDEIYRLFLAGGINYGEPFQCLDAFHYSQDLFWGRIVADEANLTDLPSPYILDAAIQTVLLGARESRLPNHQHQIYVPFSLENIVIHTQLTPTCDVFVVPRQPVSDTTETRVFDVFLANESGEIVVEMHGVHIRSYQRVGSYEQAVGVEKVEQPAGQPNIGQPNQTTRIAGQSWAIAATFTAEPIAEPLQAWFSRLNWQDQIHFAPYNQVYQALLGQQSVFAANTDGVNAIICRLDDLVANGTRTAPTRKNGLPKVSSAQIERHLTDCERFVLPNGMEIAHLKSYETSYLYEEIFVEKTYVKHGISFEPGEVIVDIGGNIGMFSLFAATQCPDLRIFSCEPSPISYEILRKNLALYAPQAKALQAGIADKDGEAEFVFYPNASVWSGFHTDETEDGEALKKSMENEVTKRFSDTDSEAIRDHLDDMIGDRLQKQTYQVRMRSLASIMQEHHIETIGLLKVDAEKCEWDILSSITDEIWPNIRQVVVEVHDKEGTTANKIAQLLRDKGFELATVEEEMLKSSGLANFYARRPVADTDNQHRLTSFEQAISDNVKELLTLVRETQHSRRGPTLFVLCPPSPEMKVRFSAELLNNIPQMMQQILGDKTDIIGIDLNSELAAAYDVTEYHDAVRDEMGHIPYIPAFFDVIASVLVRHIHAFRRSPYKVIALDCDNTLWSGVVGELGAEGVEIDSNYRALQQFMLRQKEQGMLLCLVSKNNHEDVRHVFDSRDDMILQWDDFVDTQINWNAKSANLQHLAKTLNLGLDSFVFLDDSPIECAEVSAGCPQVLSLRLPDNSDDIPGFLAHVWAFDQGRHRTNEDTKRTHMYQEQVQREAFRQSVFSMEAFIRGLALDITIEPATPDQAERLSQLTHRTNQFNFAKAPYSVADIVAKIQSPEQGCLSIRVADRFGDYGVCGLCLFSERETVLSVDGGLISCRVLGRGVEYQMLNALGRQALERKKAIVEIRFVASDKNKPAENFLRSIKAITYVPESSSVGIYTIPAAVLAELVFTPSSQPIDSTDHAQSESEAAPQQWLLPADTSLMQQIADHRGRLPVLRSASEQGSAAYLQAEQEKVSQPVVTDEDAILNYINIVVVKNLRECLKKTVDIDEAKAFSEYGVDSFAAINLVVKLNGAFAIKLPSTVLFDYGCVNDLRRYLMANYQHDIVTRMQSEWPVVDTPDDAAPGREDSPTRQSAHKTDAAPKMARHIYEGDVYEGDIAVIGMSARFPGVANVDAFWSLLLEGGTCISDVPATRWNIADYFDEDRTKPNKTYGRWGGFIEDIDQFDASFFGISGKEARQMDPQQRLFLQESWHALEDAGYANREIKDKKWAVYAGADAGDYQVNLRQHGIPLDASSFMGNDSSILAARIAYFMDMKGPAMAIDTASSSSLAAVHLACESLRNGAVDMAIAGGVSIHTTANFHILCAKAGMLSADGRCKPFDHRADGFVPGEAVGIVILKRLQDAIDDKDHIYSVIKGSAMNQDGKTNGITAPSSRSQTDLICQVYDALHLSADELTYIEAHGTGTKLGDPIEITALTDAFRRQTPRTGFCAIGSVKSNIGHCVHASGVSALIKLLLSFKHRKLAPSVNFEKPNPLIPFEDTPFVVNTQVQDWQPNAQGRRIAAVSSFGFSGTNVHMVLEEFRPADVSPVGAPLESNAEPALLLLSARSEAQLHDLARQLNAYIQQHPHLTGSELKDIAYTLQLGRESLGHRLAIAGRSDAEILTGLNDYLNRNTFAQSYLTGTVTQGEKNKGNSKRQQAEIEAFIQQRDLRGLAGQWLEGRQIDWTAWYQAPRQRVAGLPLYPFEQERYWLPDDNGDSTPVSSNHGSVPSVPSVAVTPTSATLSSTNAAVGHTSAERTEGKRVLASLQTFQAESFQVSSLNAPHSPFHLTDEGQGIFCLQLHDADGYLPEEEASETARLSQLLHLFNEIKSRKDISVLLLSGGEHRFLPALEDDATLFWQQALYRAVLELPFPVIASVPGDCKGYAWLFVCLCDFAVLSTTGRYQYVSRKQVVSQQLYHLLSERFSPAAAQILLTDWRGIEGRHLKELGVLMPVFPSAEVAGESLKLAQELATVPREALVQLKRHLAAGLTRQSVALAESPVAFAVGNAAPETDEFVVLTEDKLQAFEAGQLELPPGEPRKVALNSPVIDAEVYDNGVLLVRLCERESRNKFSKAFVAGFDEVFAHIRHNQRYKVVVLTGYGHYFASGGTLETLQAIQKGSARFTDEKIFALPLECDIPVIAAMQGHGIGPGWAVGMFCDEAVFSQESVYYSPYMRYGFTPGAGSTLILPRRLGLDLAREVLFTAREYKGGELQARGLKNPVLERAQVLPFALAAANALARMPRDELVAWKTQRAQHIRNQVEANYALELQMHEHTFVGNQDVLARIQQHFNQGMSGHVSAQDPADRRKVSVGENTKAAGSVGAVQQEHGNNVVFEQVYSLLRRMLADELQIKIEHIDGEQPFVDLGLDSITGVTWIRKINAEYGLTLNAAEVYSYPNLSVFTGLVVSEAARHTVAGDGQAGGAERTSGLALAPVAEVVGNASEAREGTADSRKNTNAPAASMLAFLSQTLSQELQIKPQAIDPTVAFVDLGLDSITGVTWIRKINQHYGLNLNAADVYSYPTLQEFAVLVQRYSREDSASTPDSEATGDATVTLPANSDAQEGGTGLYQTSVASAEQTPSPAARAEPQAAAIPGTANMPGIANTESVITPSPVGRQAIAIVGMSGQFPKAKNLQQFWNNLRKGEDCISEVPPERWAIDDFFDRNRKTPGKTYSKWMGVLEDADKFDPLFFNISPREAEMMDPQQRVFLEACWGCIEDAGYNPADLSGSRCGVFVGCGDGDYEARFGMELNAQTFMGNAISILAARIAYHLDLQGPSLAIDTACSSSLVAIASACDSLVLGNSDLALAGGVSVLAGPSMHIMTSKAGMLSEDGRCFTFDQRANGFVPGEGVGVVLLKRLEDAINDQDVIHGVIKGWGVNQDGKSNGITAPNGNAQSRLAQTVYTDFGIDPAQIQYVETHGTGTKLGDPVEVVGLKQAFSPFTRKENYCALGSVKSNIGHTLRAAGVASVLKVLLAMKHQQIPPTLHHQNLNEHIALDGTPFYVNRELKDWTVASGQRRLAAISSFGFSGTNAHIVIEQFPAEEASVRESSAWDIAAGEAMSRHPALILLSAKNDQQLRQMAANLLAHVGDYAKRITAQGERAYLHSLAYTLQTGREAMSERLGLVAHSLDELQRKLSAVLAGEQHTVDLFYQGKSKSHREVLSVFDVDEDMHELVQAWASKGKFAKLLEIWVKGLNIDWRILYSAMAPAFRPRRVSLPTYPFARERYWVDLPSTPTDHFRITSDETVLAATTTDASDAAVAIAGHPAFSHGNSVVTDEAVNELQQTMPVPALVSIPGDFSAYGNMMATGVMAAQKQLPGLLLLESARRAWEQAARQNRAAPPHAVELNYILWGQPARVQDALNGHIQTYISREEDGLYFQCVTEQAGESVTHSFGQIALNATADGRSDTLDIHTLEKQLDTPRNHQITHQIRRMFDEDGMRNQALIEKVGFDGEQLLVTFTSLAELPGNPNAATFRPILLTTCWQLLSALNDYRHSQTGHHLWYPFSLDSIIACGPVTGSVTVHLSPTPAEQEPLIITGDIPGYDLRVYDESGVLGLWLRNLKIVKEDALLSLEHSQA